MVDKMNQRDRVVRHLPSGGGTMILDDVFEIKTPAPDSQFRLLPCRRCQSDNVAYEHYNGRGGAAWRVKCFDCGHTVDKGRRVRHDAQLAWNGGNHNG